jgi:hypothetical protein
MYEAIGLAPVASLLCGCASSDLRRSLSVKGTCMPTRPHVPLYLVYLVLLAIHGTHVIEEEQSMTPPTIDLKRQHKDLYRPRADMTTVVEVPEMRFLAVDGVGDPDTAPAYMQAVEALYSVAYALKFLRKRRPGAFDSPVMPLEGLWWTPECVPFSFEPKVTGTGRPSFACPTM